jgi:hypothetical protein
MAAGGLERWEIEVEEFLLERANKVQKDTLCQVYLGNQSNYF